MSSKLSLFMRHSEIAYQTEQLFVKEVFESMISLESDKMNTLWPHDSLTLTFYETF